MEYTIEELVVILARFEIDPCRTTVLSEKEARAIIGKLVVPPEIISVTREKIEQFVGGSLCPAMASEDMADAVQAFLLCLGIKISVTVDFKGKK